jgi:O-antigen ligase
MRRLKPFPILVATWTGVACTVAINPWFAYDPINLPKMFFLALGAGLLLGWLLVNLSIVRQKNFQILIPSLLFISFLIFSILTNNSPLYQQFWGVWGRSTGLLSYISFITILIVAMFFSSADSLKFVRTYFEKLGYFISAYTLIQVLDLDPINWSQKLLVATLGNINFMSSFIGMTTISYTSRFLVERISFTSKIFYILLTIVNIWLILISGSIQGAGVFLAGLTLLIAFKLRQSLKYRHALAFFLSSVSVGIVALFGTAGIGPLSFLRQETVIFRLDYWRAGTNMLMSNPFNGVGIDSYGDFYREYRTLEAVTRTGPQRVTNTAHNIFLDVFSGSGIIAGSLFFLIMIITLRLILVALRENQGNFDFISSSAIWLGFMVFCLISINQIGVGVWGFIFTGLVCGFTLNNGSEDKSSRNDGKKNIRHVRTRGKFDDVKMSEVSNSFGKSKATQFSVALLTAAFGLSALIPNIVDARFLKAVSSANLDAAISLIDQFGIQDFHREKLVTELVKSNRKDEALAEARELLELNPHNWFAWVTVISSENAPEDFRREAGQQLIRLDPNNRAIRADVAALLGKSK